VQQSSSGGLFTAKKLSGSAPGVAHGSAEVFFTLRMSSGTEYLLLKVLNYQIIMIKRVYTSHQKL
jgi:hypothetical protein